jgi:hypothetical protein
MTAARPTVEYDSRPSGPTLDLHTDAIIMREGAEAVGSTYLRGTSSCPTITPTPTTTSVSIALGTPTASERSPFAVRQTAFRAAPVITVGPSPAMERVRLREAAAQGPRASPLGRGPGSALLARRGGARSGDAAASLSWPVLAAFAIGAAMAVAAQLFDDRGVELAALAAVIAGTRTLAAAFPGLTGKFGKSSKSGKSRARPSTSGRH